MLAMELPAENLGGMSTAIWVSMSLINDPFTPDGGRVVDGPEGAPAKPHFALELHSQFTYQPGRIFGFSGDVDRSRT
jgi:hypothetical protein